jgi:chorismate synthase/very-short-patch-repair endonuclease
LNSFGRIFRIHIFGESHGDCAGITIDGCPAGLRLSVADFITDIERRKGGIQKGTTPRQEEDIPIIKSGIFNDITTGAPITMLFENKNVRSADYEKQRDFPRPGHADFVAHEKFGGYEDYRGSGHFSGRLTVGLVAAGVIAKKLLKYLTPDPSPLERGTKSGSPFGYVTSPPESFHNLVQFAKENRHHSTEAEDKLWQLLRNRNIESAKFRRQHPIAGFIPDFVCLEKKLIIEIDGSYHNEGDQKKYDAARSEWLNQHRYELLRFTNEDILNNEEKSINRIREALKRRVDYKVTRPNSPSSLERELEGEVNIQATILEIGGAADIDKGLQKAIDAKDSIGGIIECKVSGLPAGLGEPFFDSMESLISHIVFAIPAVRGIEFGTGFAAAKMFGSEHNDPIIDAEGSTKTNHAGGVVGGITNGNEMVFRVAIKPTSSTPRIQQSLNWNTGKVEEFSVKGRHDLCIALRVPVIVEAVTAIVVADLMILEQKIKRVLE